MWRAIFSLMLLQLVESRIVAVTGATGRTGSAVYLSLKAQGVYVRGLVRPSSIDKARTVLGCDKCDESEGIFVGDIKNESSMVGLMTDADSLVIATAPAFKCLLPDIYVGCTYYSGAEPYNISWLGVRHTVAAFASSAGPALADRHVTLMSNTLTTIPDSYIDKVGHGHGCFYGLQGEVFLLASGVPYTIIKASGLSEGPGGTQEIVTGKWDEGWKSSDPSMSYIERGDVARLLIFAVQNPDQTQGLRFDVTAMKSGGTPTTDVSTVFSSTRNPWATQEVDLSTLV